MRVLNFNEYNNIKSFNPHAYLVSVIYTIRIWAYINLYVNHREMVDIHNILTIHYYDWENGVPYMPHMLYYILYYIIMMNKYLLLNTHIILS